MDREQVLLDLREWLLHRAVAGIMVSPQRVIEKINELEEEYE